MKRAVIWSISVWLFVSVVACPGFLKADAPKFNGSKNKVGAQSDYASIELFDLSGKAKLVSGAELEALADPVSLSGSSSTLQVSIEKILSQLKAFQASTVQFSGPQGDNVQFSWKEALDPKHGLLLMSAGSGEWKLVGKKAALTMDHKTQGVVSSYLRRVKEIRILETTKKLATANSTSACSNTKVYVSIADIQNEAEKVCILNLAGQGLTEIPAQLFELPGLRELYLGRNELKSLPSQIGKLSSLETLAVGRNNLTSLPKEIGELKQLTILKLGRNRINSLPPEIGNLSKVTKLELDNNELSTIPDEIGMMESLKELELVGNPVSAEERQRLTGRLSSIKIEWE